MSDEQLDAFDEGLQPLGAMDRRVVHRDGLWHHVFHCLIVRPDAPARVLLQRRLSTARSFAGLLDLSVTGHLSSGETVADGAREIREELGIDVDPGELVGLGQRLMIDDAGEGRNREVIHAFLLPLQRALEDFDLAGCDVDGLVEIAATDLLQILGDPNAEAAAREIDTDGVVRDIVCSGADLTPAVDGYWTVLTVMAERYVAGERVLAI